jgi:Asp-tRNA(Asn)/Glu-tRNA(Gln) amidotransferase C subunit
MSGSVVKRWSRRQWLGCALRSGGVAALGLLARPRQARADLWGGDVAVLIGIAKQLWDMYTTAQQMLSRLDDQITFARRMSSTLADQATHLDSVPAVFGLLDNMDSSYMLLKNNVGSLGFESRNLRDRFDKMFPSGKDLKNAKYSDYSGMYAGAQEEIRAAAGTAAQAQANVAHIEASTKAAKKILSTSGEQNVQGQLDRIVQMLGVMQGTLVGMTEQLTTAGRVTTSMAAAAANENLAERDLLRRAKEKRVKTKTVRVPDKLP